MGHSVVPQAIDGMIDALTAWPALDGVQIIDGEATGTYTEADLIAVAFDDEGPCVEGDQEPAELGAQRRQETFHIHNECSSWMGTDDMRACRTRVWAVFGGIEDCLRAHPDFAGGVCYGDIRAYDYSQDQTDKGVTCTIKFLVSIQPFHRF